MQAIGCFIHYGFDIVATGAEAVVRAKSRNRPALPMGGEITMSCTISEYLFFVTAAATICLLLIGARQSAILMAMLRLRHPVMWNRLGRPDTSNTESAANALGLARFVWRREYEGLGDQQLSDACKRARRSMLLSVLAIAITLSTLISTSSLENTFLMRCWSLR